MAIKEYDESFKNRLRAFQRDHDLVPDGKLDAADWAKLTGAPTGKVRQQETEQAVTQDKPIEVAAPVAATEDEFSIPIFQEEYPLLFAAAAYPATQAGAKEFILAQTGVDVDAVIEDLDKFGQDLKQMQGS